MDDTNEVEAHRSGFVAVIGSPNVGKSTLINAFMGQTIAAVSPKAQTTRARQLAILTRPGAQIIFVDTPGLHRPQHRLGEKMNEAAQIALQDPDVLLVLFDLSRPPNTDDQRVAERVTSLKSDPPILVALNKIDVVPPQELKPRWQRYEALIPEALALMGLSATRGDGRADLLNAIVDQLPPGPRLYPEEQVTDAYERQLAADLIRAAALEQLHQEVPYGIAVSVEAYEERGDRGARIAAIVYVERESHKGIVIGKGGAMIRSIGTEARREIERMSGRKVYLDLRVKVLSGWTNDEGALKRLGYSAG